MNSSKNDYLNDEDNAAYEEEDYGTKPSELECIETDDEDEDEDDGKKDIGKNKSSESSGEEDEEVCKPQDDSVRTRAILKEINRANPFLKSEDEDREIQKMKDNPDKVREFLILHNLPAAMVYFKKADKMMIDRGDVLSIISEGMGEAFKDFDIEHHDERFLKFAIPYIKRLLDEKYAKNEDYKIQRFAIRLDKHLEGKNGESDSTYEHFASAEVDPEFVGEKYDAVAESDKASVVGLVKKILCEIGGIEAEMFEYMFFKNKTFSEVVRRFGKSEEETEECLNYAADRVKSMLHSHFGICNDCDVR